MLDISNRQGWICRSYRDGSELPIMLGMADLVDIGRLRESLKNIMEREGIAPTTLSLKLGKSKTLIKDLLEKTGDVQLSTINRIADALGVSTYELLGLPSEKERTQAIRATVIDDVLLAASSLLAMAQVGERQSDAFLTALPTIAQAASRAREEGRDVLASVSAVSQHMWLQLQQEALPQ